MPWHHRQRHPQGLYGGKTVVDLVFKYGERLLADDNITALEDEEAKRGPRPQAFQKQSSWKARHQHAHHQMSQWRRQAAAPSPSLPDRAVLMGDFNSAPDKLPDDGSSKHFRSGRKGDHLWTIMAGPSWRDHHGGTITAKRETVQMRWAEIKSDGEHTMVTALESSHHPPSTGL